MDQSFESESQQSAAESALAPLPVIDSHCHLDDQQFNPDRPAVLSRARANGVSAIVVPAVSRPRFESVRKTCLECSIAHAAYGLHPLFFDQHTPADIEHLSDWLASNQAVAVGECGLDYHTATADRPTQQHLFESQLGLAAQYNLPLIVHANKAVEDVLQCIRRSAPTTGVVHSFNGSEQQARRLIDLGWSVGFGGAITHSRSTRLRKLVQQIPLSSILLETDAPYQSGAGHTGQRNEPAFIASVLSTMAGLLELSAEEVAATTTRNAQHLFKLSSG